MSPTDPQWQTLLTQLQSLLAAAPPLETISWQDFRAEFQGFYEPPLRPRSTRFSVRRALDVCEELGVAAMADLTPGLVTRYCQRVAGKDGKPITLRTVRGQLVYLRLACKYAVKQRYLDSDPTLARSEWIPDRALEDPLRTHLSAAEALAILRQADFEAISGDWKACRLQFLVYLLAYAGLRAGEARALERDDIDLDAGLICVKRNSRRGLKTADSAAFLPMAPPLWDLAKEWLPMCGGTWAVPATNVSKPWQYGGPRSRALDQIRALGLRAEVKGVTLRIWRPTVATLLEATGCTDEQIQKILRHTSPLTAAQHYRKRDVPTMRGHVARIVYDAPPVLLIHEGA